MQKPQLFAVLELLKPITWFAPMWAYMCGVVSSGVPIKWGAALLGAVLAGPLVCATSQAVNDWYDREVDAINQPERPIPSGRIPGNWGFYIGCVWSVLSLIVAATLGSAVLAAAVLGLALAWAYSAPPYRLKLNGWYGNSAVALCYEGLPWFTGAAAMTGAFPSGAVVLFAFLYSFGAHGIMTLNDFKAIEGDKVMGVRSLPVQLGVDKAVRLACVVMAAPQVVAIFLLAKWGHPFYAVLVVGLFVGQLVLMARLLRDPRGQAAYYNATGTTLYVLGMLVSAFALRAG
ncbi:chlorophyll synthase [Rhodoblastus acidophilus]|uniref:Chlorophyll synthase n=1 Tax=Rhodoblastus acidophilus TaxID=1074 RepID=A0A212S0P3_RHOAC|nr:chlorophyll synthase ChlG [Rhodoblastus acidophilus]PPQ38224.1 bacteriochlorophyll/chlorophyll a synthase [Rhodoblastus acidophilus]RAI21751.1 bacteriochlorophyll/chlorophyll a synthase [Rhodoblastus acidophilus]SNB78707.1 chlorophyll synthase [Rhodoblastus acidophilus]